MVAVIELLDEGATVPFIARYRKEITGNLDEVQIRGIQEKLEYFRELEDRRETVLASIEEQGKLTPELRARIEAALEKTELEDLYLPYKPKRRTKASIAREKGFEPLAQWILGAERRPQPLAEFAATFGDPAEACRGAPHHRGVGEREGGVPQSGARDDDGGRPRHQPGHRRRGGSGRKVPDVREL